MKHHHCHCGLKAQVKKFRAKKLGLVGVVLMGLHILFHVVECLVLPAILVAFSGAHDEATATNETVEVVELDEAETVHMSFELTGQFGSSLAHRFEDYCAALLAPTS